MALRWMEGFENDQTITDLTRKYATAPAAVALATGRLLGKAFSFVGATSGCSFRTPSLGAQSTWYVGMSMFVSSGQMGNAFAPMALYTGTSSQISLNVSVTSNLQYVLILKRGATTIATSAALSCGVWATVEMKIVINTSTGSYDVRVNGTSVMSGSGVNTANAGGTTADAVEFHGFDAGSGSSILYDDIYVFDSTGSTNNNFVGTVVIEGLFPNADGATDDWNTLSGGSHYAEVDEQNADDDTSYIETPDNAKKDLFGFSNLSFISGNILGVQVNTQAKVSISGTRTFSHVFRDGTLTTEDTKTAKSVTSTTYDHFFDVWDQNPQSAAPWTVSDVNNAQFGVLSVA